MSGTESGEPQSNWMVVGRVAGAFGLAGEIKVERYTDDPDRFASLPTVYLEPSHRSFAVERARRHKNLVVLKLEGIDTPEAVHPLVDHELLIPREQALPLSEGEYWLEEMLGARMVTEHGAGLGIVTDVLRTGANDVFVVGRGSAEVLVPATRDAVASIDVVERLIVVREWVLQPAL